MSHFGSSVVLTRESRMRSSVSGSENARRGENRLVSFTLPGLSACALAMLHVSKIVDPTSAVRRHKQPAPERSSKILVSRNVD